MIVAGIGTDVGKTVVSAVLTLILNGEYWKPIECGDSDSRWMKQLLGKERVHPSAYRFESPLSPHHAARLEGRKIGMITFPQTAKPLVIEGAGGILVPLASDFLSIDLYKTWPGKWILVSKHYLGSINHTLLTLSVLKAMHIKVHGIIFNGEPNNDSESVILERADVDFWDRLLPQPLITLDVIKQYGDLWAKHF